MRLFIRISQITRYLFDLHVSGIGGIGEGDHHLVSLLDRHFGIIQRPSIHSGRRACLEPPKRDPDPAQGILEPC